MPDKVRRQAVLLRLVRQRALARQEEIVAQMRRAGFEVTQASISRDIHELGLVKVDGRYLPRANLAANAPPNVPAAVVGMVIGVEPVGANLVVVRTTSGTASTVAVAIDEQALGGVAGTIAGDDTIFVAVRSRPAQMRVIEVLRSWAWVAKAG
jgi:transcriptional regulator of arginine metabolism